MKALEQSFLECLRIISIYTHFYIFVAFISYFFVWFNVSIGCYFIVFHIYIYLLSLHIILHFLHFYFSTCIFVYFHICMFLYFHAFLFFYIFYIFYLYFSLICVSYYVLLYMYWMFVCDYVLMYVLHVSVLLYPPTYCGGCLMRGRRCLLIDQHLMSWARVYRIDLLWDKL